MRKKAALASVLIIGEISQKGYIMTLSQPRNYLISNVTLNWARLDTPMTSPFGGPANWELQISTTDKAVADEMSANHLNVKEKDGVFTVSLRRKSVKADGSPMDPVRVVDANKAPVEGSERRRIGNGSVGNVIVWQAPYNSPRGSGVSNSLTAVQVTKLEEYAGSTGVDFDVVSTDDSSEAPLF